MIRQLGVRSPKQINVAKIRSGLCCRREKLMMMMRKRYIMLTETNYISSLWYKSNGIRARTQFSLRFNEKTVHAAENKED